METKNKNCLIVKTFEYSGISLWVDDDFDEDYDSPILKGVLRDFPKESRQTIIKGEEIEIINTNTRNRNYNCLRKYRLTNHRRRKKKEGEDNCEDMFHLGSYWCSRRTLIILEFGGFYKNWEFYLESV